MSVDVRRLRRELVQVEPTTVGIQVAKYATLLFFSAVILLPFLFVFLKTFFLPIEFYRLEGVHWFPERLILNNWIRGADRLSVFLGHSMLYASGTAIITLALGIPGAYVFARKRFPYRQLLFYAVVLSLLIPGLILIPVLTDLYFEYGIYDTVYGLWISRVPQTAIVVWILRDFFQKLPAHLEDSARIYGCTQFTAFVHVILPLSAPAVVAVGFLEFLWSWNDYLLSNMLTSAEGPRPVAVALYYDMGLAGAAGNWPLFLTEAFIVGVPPIVFYALARKHIAEGLALGT